MAKIEIIGNVIFAEPKEPFMSNVVEEFKEATKEIVGKGYEILSSEGIVKEGDTVAMIFIVKAP